MTKDRRRKQALERTVAGKTYYTVYGMCAQLPGRKIGTKLGLNTLMQYVREGAPCFESCGIVYFDKDLTAFRTWLEGRRPLSKVRADERAARREAKIYG